MQPLATLTYSQILFKLYSNTQYKDQLCIKMLLFCYFSLSIFFFQLITVFSFKGLCAASFPPLFCSHVFELSSVSPDVSKVFVFLCLTSFCHFKSFFYSNTTNKKKRGKNNVILKGKSLFKRKLREVMLWHLTENQMQILTNLGPS